MTLGGGKCLVNYVCDLFDSKRVFTKNTGESARKGELNPNWDHIYGSPSPHPKFVSVSVHVHVYVCVCVLFKDVKKILFKFTLLFEFSKADF